MKAAFKKYFWNVLVALDQLANTILGGDPDETMSSRMGKHVQKGTCKLCKVVCKVLDLFQKDHCILSIEKDEGTKSVIP